MTEPLLPARPQHFAPIEIVGCGFSYPSDIVDNEEYFSRCQFDITEDKSALIAATRMRTRAWCADGENTFTMARDAVDIALRDANIDGENIDVVLVSSCSTIPGFNYPNADNPVVADLSPLLMNHMGCKSAFGVDIKATYCAGFIRGLQLLDALLQNPNYETGLLVCSDQGGRFATARSNRSSFCFIVGDAAGAVVAQRRHPGRHSGVLDYEGALEPEHTDLQSWGPDGVSLVVRGSKTQKVAMRMLLESANTLLARNGLTAEDVQWFLPMQGHAAMVDALVDELSWPKDKVLWKGDQTGYAASASLAAAFSNYVHDGVIAKGDLVLSVAVGAGINSGAALYRR